MIQLPRFNSSSSCSLVTIIFISLLPFYFFSYMYRSHHPYSRGDDTKTLPDSSSTALSPSDVFMQTWLSTHLLTPLSPSALASYCNATPQWHPNLVFNLADANGGIGNVRGNFLDFVFFSIELGASILLPGMASRQTENLSNVWGGRQQFDAMFDVEWFLWTLREACPQMSVYRVEQGMEMVKAVDGWFWPRTRRVDEDFENSSEMGRRALEEWLVGNEDFVKRYGGLTALDETGSDVQGGEEMVLVNLERTLWNVDTRSLPRGMRRNFGQLLKVGAQFREIAALVVWRLGERFQLDLNPSEAVPKGQFYGAHLRTADDAKNAGWMAMEGMNATAQMNEYITHARESGLKIVYVASGKAEDVRVFQERAAAQEPPMLVVSKTDLLSPHEVEKLDKLSWDQQALVDWEVLKRCSIFGGIVKSSFAFNIAMSRSQYLEDRSVPLDPWSVQHSEADMTFDDGISRIFGRDAWHEQRIPRGMWP